MILVTPAANDDYHAPAVGQRVLDARSEPAAVLDAIETLRQASGPAGGCAVVVDDEASIRELLEKTLAMSDYDVDTAPDGRTALERMRLYPYDLLITDLRMPGMDGLTVIREAKRYKADLPVLVITGFSTESSAIEAVNLGVAGCAELTRLQHDAMRP